MSLLSLIVSDNSKLSPRKSEYETVGICLSFAVFLDVGSSYGPFNDPNGKFPMTWPPKDHFAKVMCEIGVSNNDHVILYASTYSYAKIFC